MLRELQQRFLTTLSKAQDERPNKKAFVPSPDDKYPEPEWVLYERETMLSLVNEQRAKDGKPPINREELLRAERTACGHVDYSRKFALYCAELALK